MKMRKLTKNLNKLLNGINRDDRRSGCPHPIPVSDSLLFYLEQNGRKVDNSPSSVQPRMALENRDEDQALPGGSGQDALSWSVLSHSVSTSASFVAHGPETAPDVVRPLSVSPSSAPKEDKKKGPCGKWPT